MAGLGARAGDVGRCGRALRHPVFVVATATLLLNDRWWKSAWPGWVTGKLSDVAGVVVAAVLVSAVGVLAGLTPRRASWSSVAVVGALFASMKWSDAGAGLAERAWSWVNGGQNVVIADRTDLIALLALPLAPMVWRRTENPVPHARRRLLRAGATVVMLGAGFTATTATSCVRGPGIVAIVRDGDRLYAVDADWLTMAFSDDLGTTWKESVDPDVGVDPFGPSSVPSTTVGNGAPSLPTVPAPDTTGPGPGPGLEPDSEPEPTVPVALREPAAGPEPTLEVCRGDRCWTVDDGTLVRTEGNDREVDLAAVPSHGDQCGGGYGEVMSVVDVDRGERGRLLVAAMGDQGLAASDGAGEWRRFEVGGTIPDEIERVSPMIWAAVAMGLALAPALLGWTIGRPRVGSLAEPRSVAGALAMGVPGLGLAFVGGYLVSWLTHNDIMDLVVVPVGLMVLLGGLILCFFAGRELAPARGNDGPWQDLPWRPEPPESIG